MTTIACPCSNVETEDDGKDRRFEAECSICAVNGGDYKKSPFWKEPVPPPMDPAEKLAKVVELHGRKPKVNSSDGDDSKDPKVNRKDRKADRQASAAQAGHSSPDFVGRRK